MSPLSHRYHPKWFRQRTPIFWWLDKPSYVVFITRELTSLGVAYAALLLLCFARAVAAGAESLARLQAFLASPWAIAFHSLLLAVLLVHSLTWLHLAPKAMVVKLGGKRVPGGAILAGHYAGWLAASAAIAWILLGG